MEIKYDLLMNIGPSVRSVARQSVIVLMLIWFLITLQFYDYLQPANRVSLQL